jgi:colanic acid biosynthesis glycosyl transferase WcaI
MKLLFVNQHYGMETPATGTLLCQLAEGLAAKGHTVTVIAEARGPHDGPPEGAAMAFENGVRVLRIRSLSIGQKSVLRRLAHYASYFVLASLAGLRVERPDALVALSTPPLLAPLLARMLALYHRVPYYYNIQDLYPDVAIGMHRLPLALHRPTRAIARSLERRAAGVSAVGERMARRVTRRAGRPVAHLANWADPDEITPLDDALSIRKAWGLEGRFVVQYAGNLGVCHDAENIAAVVEQLRDQPIDFVFVGAGTGRALVERHLYGKCRVHFFPFQPRARLSAVLNACDVGWVNLARGASTYVVPSKTHGIMAAGRPVLAVSDPGDDLYKLVKSSRGGLWVGAGDPAAIAQTILRLYQSPALRMQMGRRGRRHVETLWNRQAAVEAWERWLGAATPAGLKQEREAA